MLSLLRADLRRINRSHAGFRGYLFLLLLLIVANVVVSKLLAGFLAGQSSEAASSITSYPSATSFCAMTLMAFGVAGILACWSSVSICWIDMRAGYDRSIISSVGKHIYYGEKLLLALAVSAIFVLIGTVVSMVLGFAMGSLAALGSVASLLAWMVLTIIVVWSCAALCLTVLWLLRNQVLSYLLGLCLCTGAASSIFGLVLANFGELAELWSNVSAWLPVGAFNALSTTLDGSLSFEGDALAHMLVPTAVCLVVSFVVANTVLRHRDI